MEPIKQRTAIAEYCGWKGFEMVGEDDVIGVPPQNEITEQYLGSRTITNWTPRTDVPDYLNDLNAMHEAETALKNSNIDTWHNYWYNLTQICEPSKEYWRATAEQRAEAFLKTIGKWKE